MTLGVGIQARVSGAGMCGYRGVGRESVILAGISHAAPPLGPDTAVLSADLDATGWGTVMVVEALAAVY